MGCLSARYWEGGGDGIGRWVDWDVGYKRLDRVVTVAIAAEDVVAAEEVIVRVGFDVLSTQV
jgi:hypothetical protein